VNLPLLDPPEANSPSPPCLPLGSWWNIEIDVRFEIVQSENLSNCGLLLYVNDRRWKCAGRCTGDGLHARRDVGDVSARQDDRDGLAGPVRRLVDDGCASSAAAASRTTTSRLHAGSARPHQDQHQSLRPDTGTTEHSSMRARLV